MTVNINAANISSVRLAEQSGTPGTPASNFARIYVSTTPRLRMMDDAGAVTEYIGNTSGSGVGITFPATQSASTDANTLDDYEEGTWTPTITGTTTAGTATTYSGRTGRYTKIGDVVFVQAVANVSSSDATGRVRISLPAIGNATAVSSFFTWTSAVDWPSGSNVVFQVVTNQAYAELYSYGDNIASAQVTDCVGYFELSGFYFI